MNYQEQIISYFSLLKETIDKINTAEIQKALECLTRARDTKHFIYTMGNGGSAATASHWAGDFNKGMSLGQEKRYRFMALNDNEPTILSLANDVSYASIFVEQLKNFLEPEDVILAISGSGNSENIVNAAQYAKNHGATVIALTGYDGGKLDKIADIHLHVPINNMQITEDLHMVFDHLAMVVLGYGGHNV
ncbi:MAG: SIS domain-containing protein [Sphaerochaetaceae bacterium]|jgi:D-sedoheptulose 7-phosphate isomerase